MFYQLRVLYHNRSKLMGMKLAFKVGEEGETWRQEIACEHDVHLGLVRA